MWIHPKCAPPPPSHLYINNLYPPEYAELDQARLTGQHDTCYASTDLLEQHYNQVNRDSVLAHCDRVSHLLCFHRPLGAALQPGKTDSSLAHCDRVSHLLRFHRPLGAALQPGTIDSALTHCDTVSHLLRFNGHLGAALQPGKNRLSAGSL
jgi:hypothetical protein